jgi:hypothetical protein
MIRPVNNIIKQEGDSYLVLPQGHFNNVFPEKTYPTLFGHHKTYLGFLHDSNPPTVYQVYKWNITPMDKPLTIRKLSIVGAKRVHKKIDPMLQSFVNKANENMQESLVKFKRHLDSGEIIEAEKDIEEAKKSLEKSSVWPGFMIPAITLPEGLYYRLETRPEELSKYLTAEKYNLGANYYLDKARDECNKGYPNFIDRLCNNAEYCAKKSLEAKPNQFLDLEQRLKPIQEIRKKSLSIAESIEKDKKTISRFSWMGPAIRRWINEGYDPFPLTDKDRAEISDAARRLKKRGLF